MIPRYTRRPSQSVQFGLALQGRTHEIGEFAPADVVPSFKQRRQGVQDFDGAEHFALNQFDALMNAQIQLSANALPLPCAGVEKKHDREDRASEKNACRNNVVRPWTTARSGSNTAHEKTT